MTLLNPSERSQMHNYIFLNADNVFLRPLEIKDITDEYLRGINNQELDNYTEHAQLPKNIYKLKEYAENKWKSSDIWLGIFLKEDEKHIGNIELSEIDFIHRKARFSIILWAEQKKGYGFQASRALIDFAFRKLNLNRIDLGVNEDNTPAINLYKKLGFQHEGVLREAFLRNDKKKNIIVMGLLKSDFYKK